MRLTLSSIGKRDFVFLVSCITLNLDKKKKKKKKEQHDCNLILKQLF